MFIRKNRNRSGSISIQIIQKVGRKNKVLETVGCANTLREEELLMVIAKNKIVNLTKTQSLFIEHDDLVIDSFVDNLHNSQLQIVGPQIVFGDIYNRIGLNQIEDIEFFKDLVICRLIYPGSKLKSIQYFQRHFNKEISVYSIYRFLDKLNSQYKDKIELLTFEHTRKILNGQIGIVFYDMTTLYFEASEEDDLRIIGYSKDGKHQQPQIMIGLLVGINGYPIGYEIFEGNTSETKTLIPIIESFQKKFSISKPIVVADAGLLSQKNIEALIKAEYTYILGGRIRNESQIIKDKILALNVTEEISNEIKHENGRLIVTYSEKRKRKDQYNRLKGLKRLEQKVKTGKLKKENINNRGYNKYLKLEGNAKIYIDYDKYNQDAVWDGLKGYITNTTLSRSDIIDAYQQLWQIEKAFRISKTDIKIRPIYHRCKNRIEAHICICFTAYSMYKELERLIKINKLEISVDTVIAQIKDIQQITYVLPVSNTIKTKLLKLNPIQKKILEIFNP